MSGAAKEVNRHRHEQPHQPMISLAENSGAFDEIRNSHLPNVSNMQPRHLSGHRYAGYQQGSGAKSPFRAKVLKSDI
jgi:hypothetical protein